MAHRRSSPRHKRLSRSSRLQAATHWIAQYPGTNILGGYRKHFGVDFECALKELTLLGITFDPQQIRQVRQSLLAQQKHRRSRQQSPLNENVPTEDWSLLLETLCVDAESDKDPPRTS